MQVQQSAYIGGIGKETKMTFADITHDRLRTRTNASKHGFDPLGLVSGWRAWRTYSELDALSDEALARRGLTRQDLPRVAFNMLRQNG